MSTSTTLSAEAEVEAEAHDGERAVQGVKVSTEAPMMLIVGEEASQRDRLTQAGKQAGFLIATADSLATLPPRLDLDPDVLVLTSEQTAACDGDALPASYRARAVLLVEDNGWAQIADAGIGGAFAASASVAELAYRLPDVLGQIQRESRARLGLPMGGNHEGLWDLIPATDWVTGLDNRLRFLQELQKNISLARRYKRPFCCLLVRFDNYEQVRQSEAGGERVNGVLEEVAGVLEVSIRDADFLARMHHDLFGLLLPETDIDSAQVVVARIDQNLEQFQFGQLSQAHAITPSFSCGMSSFDTEESSVDSLLAEAQRALEEPLDD